MAAPPFENPIVLITRPADRAAQFLETVAPIAGPFRPLVSPAFELVKVDHPTKPFDEAVFTSSSAAEFAPKGEGRVAWCVGSGTADVAESQGYTVKVGDGNAEDLCKLILREMPKGELVYFRGENVRVNVTIVLERAGVSCTDFVSYRKILKSPSNDVLSLKADKVDLIVPVFSAETVSILADWPVVFERLWVVAISKEVADLAAQLNPIGITTAAHPNLNDMSRATARLIA